MYLPSHTSMPILVMFLTCMLLEQLIVPCGSNAAGEEVVLATANAGIRITQADLDRVIQDYRKKSRQPTVTREQKIQLIQNLVRRELILQQDGIEALRKEPDIVRKVKQLEDGLVIEKFLGEHIGRYMNPDEAELKTYYRENRQRFSSPAMVEARHILLRDRPDAEQVAEKLTQGEDFIQLAKTYSIDLPLSETGGQMSALPIPKGEALPELDQVLFTLEEGEVKRAVIKDPPDSQVGEALGGPGAWAPDLAPAALP